MSNSNGLSSAGFTTVTAEIVAAYVAKNPIPTANLSALIESVHAAVSALSRPTEIVDAPLTPAVNPKRSVHPDYIVCLEDGKKFKSLKRHLMTHYGMTPDEYRIKWGLSRDYPMVAPDYAAARSILAKKMGLGKKPKEAGKGKLAKKAANTRGRNTKAQR